MNIEIKAAKDIVLGGPDRVPYLKLELYEDCNAVLCAKSLPRQPGPAFNRVEGRHAHLERQSLSWRIRTRRPRRDRGPGPAAQAAS